MVKTDKQLYMVKGIRELTTSTYVVTLDRNDLEFSAGQNLNLGLVNDPEKRDYSIYSGEYDRNLEILIKEIKEGLVSKKIKWLKKGDKIEIEGPFGFFTLKDKDIKNKKFLFVASGTGIAPFHSMVRTHKGLNYKLIHGIRYSSESYDKNDYQKERYISCVTSDNHGNFHGRVTDYLKQYPVDKETICYFCGNVNMIYEAFDILKEQGVASENLHAEVYF